ncbi:MAG: phosphonopyruvate decarboxylase [Pseudomonadota bacterium]|nr:phosphonopyruvate decarboxylase [Pseudomonadota bacterium]
MIEAQDFVEAARSRGIEWYAGVPCSFLTPFINYVINDERLTYISSANEGDAVATAAGAVIGGRRAALMIQNSGLGNAVSPLTSLTHVFRIPLLLICTHRGAPGVKDEPQHQLMGRITGRMFDTMELPWESFPTEPHAIAPVLERAARHMARERRPYGLVMQKGTVAPHALRRGWRPRVANSKAGPGYDYRGRERPARSEVLSQVLAHAPENAVLIATTGYTGRELYALADRPNHLYMVGSMGCASSLGLGLALARPDLHVVVLDGDGAALMRMGNLATVGAYGGANLIHLVLDNEAHDSTGAQSTVSAGIDFAGIAVSCGYGVAAAGDHLGVIEALFAAEAHGRARLAQIKIRTGTREDLPRPALSPTQVLDRLMAHIGTAFS